MIIFGTGRRLISGSEQQLHAACPRCQQQSVVQFVMQRYFHLFWIPTLPIGKTSMAACGHCQGVTEMQVPPTKTPLWSFAGAAIFSVLYVIVHLAPAAH